MAMAVYTQGGGGTGPRAKRAKMPVEVATKDADGPMDLTEMSRLVRDLCRQHDLDRAAWQETVDSLNDHAKRLDTLEHETLQQTDSLATAMDDLLRGLRGNEDKLREQVKNNLVELQQAWFVIDGSLRSLVDECNAGWQSYRADTTALTRSLQEKFVRLDTSVDELRANAAAKFIEIDAAIGGLHAYMATPQRAPPTTRAPPEQFDLGTPVRAGAAGPVPLREPPLPHAQEARDPWQPAASNADPWQQGAFQGAPRAAFQQVPQGAANSVGVQGPQGFL